MSTIQDNNLDESYIDHLEALTRNWEEKKSFSSQKLSGLTPFVDLYAFFDNNNTSDRGLYQKVLQSDVLDFISDDEYITKSTDSELVRNADWKAINVAKLESQLARYDYQRQTDGGGVQNYSDLTNERGGIGINSMEITRGTSEPFTARYRVNMTITDSNLINKKAELSKLLTLNSTYLLAHGWNGFELTDGNTPVSSPNPILSAERDPDSPAGYINVFTGRNKLEFNVGDKSNGYWDWNFVKLYQFNFNVNNVGHLDVNLSFVNIESSHLQFSKIRNVSNRVLTKIKKPVLNQVSDILYNEQNTDSGVLLTDAATIGYIYGMESLFLSYLREDINFSEKEELANAVSAGFNNINLEIEPLTDSWSDSKDFTNDIGQLVNSSDEEAKKYIGGFETNYERVTIDGGEEKVIETRTPFPVIDNAFDGKIVTVEGKFEITDNTNFSDIVRQYALNGQRIIPDQLTDSERRRLRGSATPSITITREVQVNFSNMIPEYKPPFVFDRQGSSLLKYSSINANDSSYLLYNLVIDISDSIIVNTPQEALFYNTTFNTDGIDLSYGSLSLKDIFSYLNDKSSFNENLDNLQNLVFSNSSSFKNEKVEGWPLQNYTEIKHIKPIAITTDQFEKFLNSKRENVIYGQEHLNNVVNKDSFYRLNKETIFENEEEDKVDNFKEKIKNRGSVLLSVQETSSQNNSSDPDQGQENGDTSAPTADNPQDNIDQLNPPLPQLPIRSSFGTNEEFEQAETAWFEDVQKNVRYNIIEWANEVISNSDDDDDISKRVFSLPRNTYQQRSNSRGRERLNNNDYIQLLLGWNPDGKGRIISSDEKNYFNQIINSYDDNTTSVALYENKEFENIGSGRDEDDDRGLENVKYEIGDIKRQDALIFTESTFYNITSNNDANLSRQGVTLSGNIDVSSAVEEVKVIEEDKTPVGYYLGAVLEAIASTVNETPDAGTELRFFYEKVPEEIRNDIKNLNFKVKTLDLQGKEISVNLFNDVKTTFDLPIDYKTVDNFLMNKNVSNTSVINLLKDVLASANSGIMKSAPRIQLAYRLRPNKDGAYEVYIASKDYGGVVKQISSSYSSGDYITEGLDNNQNKTISLNFGEKNSLVESFNVASKIDPLTYAAFRMPTSFGLRQISLRDIINNNNGDVDFLEMILSSARSGKGDLFDSIVSEGGDINERISKIEEFFANDSSEYTDQINNDITTLLLSSPEIFTGFLSAAINNPNQTTFVSDLLLNFLFNIDATIHGITGIYLLDPIIVNNFLSQTGGVYMVNSIRETISPGSFSTVLNLKLHSPFQNNPSSVNNTLRNISTTTNDDEASAAEGETVSDTNSLGQPLPNPIDLVFARYTDTKPPQKMFIEKGVGNPFAGPFYDSEGNEIFGIF